MPQRPMMFIRYTSGKIENSLYLAVFDTATGLVGQEFDGRVEAVRDTVLPAFRNQYSQYFDGTGKGVLYTEVPVPKADYESIKAKVTLLTPQITPPLA